MHRLFALALLGILLALAGCTGPSSDDVSVGEPTSDHADVVYLNGTIYTVDEAQPWAEAVAIKDGKFLVVGSNADVEAAASDSTEVVDLEGRLVIPGLVDPHTHAFEDYHARHFAFGVQDTRSPETILAEVGAYAATLPEGEWLLGGTWPNGLFPGDNPHRRELDAVISDRPVCLADQSAHAWWCNTTALETVGLMDPTVELPEGAVVERDADGVPSGTIREHAIGFARRSIPPISHEEWVEVGRGFMGWFNELGLTTTQLAAGNEAHLRAARELETDGELSVRLVVALNYGYFDSPESLEEERAFVERADELASEFVDPSYVKIFMDGVPSSYAAWVIEPYLGTDNYGTGYYGPDELVALYRDFTAMGVGVMSHAIGDRSVREVLDAIEAAQEAFPEADVRHHVTHNGMIHEDDLPRFAELGVAIDLAPQLPIPPFLRDLMVPIIGEHGVDDYANPRRAIDSGAVVATGSDWQVSFLDPWRRIAFLVARVDPDNPEWGVQGQENALTVAEAIWTYTFGPAFAMNKDLETGSITEGKYADLIVLDRNIFEIEPMEIAQTKVLRTVFAGLVVHEIE